MAIFIVGISIFVLGSVLNAIGWRLHRRTIAAAPPEFFEWLLEIFKTWFSKLVGPESTTGERVAAFGAILAALGLVTAVAGLVVWSAT
jgi:hypothetical protein